ncbi:MAG TPA: thioredoxin domain-containing protein, partial [Candidatus Binataceae bacterium]|nr:thioredoxin domain-containing protein [Candidatus Binataceae bacterium]
SNKVDREERPDLDQIYMDAVQLLTGRGGWPLTVFLTPECKPFYGGTYFPPVDRHGIPAFPRVLTAISDAYHKKPADVQQNVDRLVRAIGSLSDYTPGASSLKPGLAAGAARGLAEHYDHVNGGIGGAPKFPNTFVFSLFLRIYNGENDGGFADMTRHTLEKMARGGIHDQIGGGFHRYSVDERWLVPHFEKMLYDNALLARLYLDAGRALNHPEFFDVARRTLDYALREMTSPEGGFYSSQDADSEGEEGKFFLWTPAELDAAIGEGELSRIAARYFDVSEEGNFEGRNILHRTLEIGDAARMFNQPVEKMETAIETIRRSLFEARERRVRPGRDDKILTAWNGLMIGALAQGYRALGDRRYLEAAVGAIDFVMERMWDGRSLKRSFKDGAVRFNGYLEDYALMAAAMIDAYEASLDPRHLGTARQLADVMLDRFLDRERGGFFFTSDDHEELITRVKAAFDGSTPSGNSAAAMMLLRLGAYTGDERYLDEARRILELFAPLMEKQPFAFSHMLEAVDLYERGPTDVVIVGNRGTAEFREWIERLGLLYVPNQALFAVDPDAPDGAIVPEPAQGKTQIDGHLTAYVCRERTCSAPMVSFADLERELLE